MRLQMHFLVTHEIKREKHLSHGLIRLNDYVIPTYIIKQKYIYIYIDFAVWSLLVFYCSEFASATIYSTNSKAKKNPSVSGKRTLFFTFRVTRFFFVLFFVS